MKSDIEEQSKWLTKIQFCTVNIRSSSFTAFPYAFKGPYLSHLALEGLRIGRSEVTGMPVFSDRHLVLSFPC